MKFAEITQEVQIARPQDIYHDIGLTPGRRRMHQIARDAPGNLLSVPVHNLSFGSRAFRTSATNIWNSLPPHILQPQTLSSFRHRLKNHYFHSAYPAP